MPYADHARNIACDQRYRATGARRDSWRRWVRAHASTNCANTLRWSRARKLKIFRRDGWRCHYCQKRRPYKLLTFDHKVPRKDGGSNQDQNIVSACRSCNQRKGTKGYASFVHQIRAERGLEPLWLIEENPLALEDLMTSLTMGHG